MKFKKISAIISLILCLVMLTNSTAFAVKSQPDSAVESISIFPMYGVLEGQSRQMSATVDANGSFFDSVEWSSSNPNAISCTEDGIIKGLIAGESATITCKAKWGSVKDTIKVYCAEKIPASVKCTPKNTFTTIYAQPATGMWSGTIISPNGLLKLMLDVIELFTNAYSSADALAFSSKLTVYGRIKNYAYVKYGKSEIFDGFVKYTSLPISVDGFLELSAEDIDLWADDITYTSKKLTATYDGDVEWIYDNNYIDFDETTGQITGSKAGAGKKVTITAKADGITKTCTIHLLYKWPQKWTGIINNNTYLLLSDGDDFTLSDVKLTKGQSFIVYGDCGTNSGQTFGIANINGVDYWGYVPIHYLSTKGTVSQYNNLGWSWPVKTETGKPKANYISSPYGWRDTKPQRHQGIDITTGNPGEIKGYEVVSTFDGTVVFCGDEYGYDWGYCVAVRSNTIDPVSGLPFVAVYMHLIDIPEVERGQKVTAGKTILGYVGNTTTPDVDMGYHLHFEFNNQNSSIGLSNGTQTSGYGRKSYDYLVNPIFLYIDEYENGEISYNKTSDAEEKYMKTFWYGNGDTLDEAS